MKSAAAGILYTIFLLLFPGSCAGTPKGQITALHEAADSGDILVVEELISKVPNVDARDKEGRTALHHAAMAGDIPVTAALLNAGADPDIQDKSGRVPLHYAVLSCKPDLAAMLLAAEADPFIVDRNEQTPLDLAVERGCEVVAQTIKSSLSL